MGSWLFGNNTSVNNPTPPAQALRIQTSIEGRPITLGWGTNRISGNFLWEGDFRSEQVQVGSVGSNNWFEHIFSKAQPIFETHYFASEILGLCYGLIKAVGSAWNAGSITSASALGFTLFNGSFLQIPWDYMTTAHPTEARYYRGYGYVACANFALGTSPTQPAFSWEVQMVLSGYGAAGQDAAPADMLLDLVSNLYYGISYPWFRFDQELLEYYTYGIAAGMPISWAIVEQQSAQQIIGDLLDSTNSTARMSTGILSAVPFGDAAITANGVTFTPDVTPVYDLTLDDFLPNQASAGSAQTSDPVIVTRKAKSTALNSILYEYLNRGSNYDPSAPTTAKDEASITTYGLRSSELWQLHMFALADCAQASAILRLIREQIPTLYTFTLPPKFILLDCENVVTLSSPNQGMFRQAVRINEIQENDDASLTYTAEEFMGTAAAPLYGTQATNPFRNDFNVPAGDLADVQIFAPPDDLATPPSGQTPIWLAATGVDNTVYGGSNVYYSTDDITYTLVGVIPRSTMGELTATLPFHSDPDTVNTLSVDLTESNGVLQPGNATDVVNGIPPTYVGGEIVAYQDLLLTSPFNYDLTTLKRGAYSSTIHTHPAGTPFVLLTQGIFKMTVPSALVGNTVYFKLQPFNTFNGGVADFASLTAIPYVVGSVPSTPPSFVNAGTPNKDFVFGGSTSNSGSLPGSVVNGNLLIAWMQELAGPDTLSVSNATWAMGDQASDANSTCGWAFDIAGPGSAVAFFTWTTPAFSETQALQFTGASTVGANSNATGNSTSISLAGLTTTADASLVVAILLTGSNQAIPVPTGFTSRASGTGTLGSFLICDQVVTNSGDTSDPIASTITSAPWSAFLFEVKA